MKRTLTDLTRDLSAALRFRSARRFSGPLRHLVALVAFAAAVLALMVALTGWLYPLRPDVIGALGHPFTADPLLANAWGGPTLVGAWVVHAIVALGIQVVCLAVIRALSSRRPAHAV